MRDDGQVLGLRERVETDPQAKRSDSEIFSSTTSPGWTSPSSVWVYVRFSRMYSGSRWRRLLWRRSARCRWPAPPNRRASTQRLVAGLALVERQVVAVDDEAFGALGNLIDDVGQIDQSVLSTSIRRSPAARIRSGKP